MESQVQEQEIDAMFTKFTDAFAYIRQTFVNANQFAEQVKALQAQVTQLSQDFEQLKQHNAALDSAVNALTSERDEWKRKAEEVNVTNAALEKARSDAEKNATGWYEAHHALEDEHDKLKSQLGNRENDLREALEENAKLKAELERITGQINQIYQGLAPRPMVVEDVPHRGENQPRDPETQQFRGWPEAQSA